jgi:hypothetical protein
VSPQLLRRPSTRPAARAGSGTRTPRAAAALAQASPSTARVLRRPAVLALVAAGAVVVAVLGWTQLTSSGTDAVAPASVLVRPPAAATPGTGTTSTGAPTTQDEIAVGRDPFANESAPADTPPTTSPHIVDATPSGDATTPQPVPTDSVPTQASPGGTPSDAPGVTVTVTATGGPSYVGLYAWNGSRASFRVNARTYSVAVGTRFGPGLTFASVVRGDPPCARVTHAKGSFTLCPGQVTTLP